MNCRLRRALFSLLVVIFAFPISFHSTVAQSGENAGFEKNIPKNGKMLPFSRIMTAYPIIQELSNDALSSRFVSKEFSHKVKHYAPDDLELLTGSVVDTAGRVIYLRREARDALIALAKDFEKQFDRPLIIVSGYRSASYQQRLWDLGRCTDTLCAPPGYSEHQLGLTIDIFEATTEKDYLANRAFARYLNWFQENAHKYGYHQSYQKGEQIDGYEVEPWHWRYLGKELATELKKLDMTYTEYIEFKSMFQFWELYSGFVGDKHPSRGSSTKPTACIKA